ncbi:MAG: peptidoglycan-binding protein, partial [Roseiarcus sp.]
MIAELQRMLDDLGYDAGSADGAFGSRSVQALISFERDHGQPPSGEISATALAAVRGVWYDHNRAAAPASTGVNPTVSRPSFDCARAVAPSARTICGSAPLAQLDAEMAAAYV